MAAATLSPIPGDLHSHFLQTSHAVLCAPLIPSLVKKKKLNIITQVRARKVNTSAVAVNNNSRTQLRGRFYFNITGFPFPLGPFLSRPTLRKEVKYWVDRIVTDWPFKRIIPAHFAAPISAGPSDFKAAFAFLNDLLGEKSNVGPILSLSLSTILGRAASYFPPDDMKTLSSLDEFLVSVGAVKKTVSGRER